MFNTIGCPLLLTCMCVERYLAVVKPVLYMRVRKWEYRMAVSLVVWGVTLLFILGTSILTDVGIILTSVPIIIACLFIVMLACLGRMIWSLMQKSPAHTTHANRGPESALKRQAVYNVLVVVVPAVISYLPVLVIIPFEIYFSSNLTPSSLNFCNIFELSSLFPRFGVFIGPMFYFSKARKLC
ncbi:P2Y purinoceptor 1-like [Solea senegalensis]|uniref:P2Y purinoceptor 1-like n=2 Tax=Solea senegalensis TaxID=28829 RepID=A0AAV6QXB1_SOLSE|nr:P2Y purinoceptor 1-like [Solea senegalensis]